MKVIEIWQIFANLFFEIETILFPVYLYFGSCTPKPKWPSKAKKFLESLKEKIQTIEGSFVPKPAI